MIQIQIKIEPGNIEITITAPDGEKMKFRSAAENDAARIGSGEVQLPDQKADEIAGTSVIEKAKEMLDEGKVVMMEAQPGKINVDLNDPAHKKRK